LNGAEGFMVINPLYCYEGGKISMKEIFNGGDSVKIERSAIIVNRGWIPAELSDKRSRPSEINSRQLVKIQGCFRAGKDLHSYKHPNNPDNNDWHNLALEDIGIYWDLPNYDEAKYYYFQAVDFARGDGNAFQQESGVQAMSRDEIVEDHYEWRWNEGTHNKLEKSFGLLSAACLAIGALAV